MDFNFFFQNVTVAVEWPARLALAKVVDVPAARSSSAKMQDKRRNYQIFTISWRKKYFDIDFNQAWIKQKKDDFLENNQTHFLMQMVWKVQT